MVSKNINRLGLCCSSGKVHLPPMQDSPPELVQLYTSQCRTGRLFRDNIRAYNTCFSFTSHGGKLAAPPSIGPYCYRLHGESYHLIGSLLPPPDGAAAFAQIYFHDSDDLQLQKRVEFAIRGSLNIERNLLRTLQDVILRDNPFSYQFRSIGRLGLGNTERLVIRERVQVDDQRRFNTPTAAEIAVLMPGIQDQFLTYLDSETSNRDIILTNIDGSLKRVSVKSGAYDPLQYPLLFPFGDYGWSIPLPPAHKTSIMEFACYRLMERHNQPSLLHFGGKLFQQYVTDQFSKMEGDRLNYIKNHQDKLRVSSYSDVQDAIAGIAANGSILDGANIGSRLVLPATYIGSPRFMNNIYQDAMAVVRHFGFPDLFVTFTTNPFWPEIQRELKEGQTASDRPDLVARVFNLKLKSLLKELSEIIRFAARVHSIEFQKRGLPHAHILIILKSAHKPKTATTVESMVSAEMP
jgi:hypothetical protein